MSEEVSTGVYLTAEQMLELAELEHDSRSVDETLKLAITHCSNMRSEWRKKGEKFWKELAEANGWDLTEGEYKVDHANLRPVVMHIPRDAE